MLSPRDLLLNSANYLVSASEPLATISLAMFQNLLSKFFYAGEMDLGGSIAPPVSETTAFNPTRCAAWFDHLCLREEGIMTAQDILTFCHTIQKEPGDIVFLILSYKMGVKTCGTISQREWISAMSYFGIDSNDKLIDKWENLRNLLNEDRLLERSVYRFAYDYVRDRDQDGCRIDVQLGAELVRMFLEKKWKYCEAFLRFLTLTKVKALTRDQFMNIIDFSREVTSLEGYDDSGAWPLLLDEFVSHATRHKDLYLRVLNTEVSGVKITQDGSTWIECSDSDLQFPLN